MRKVAFSLVQAIAAPLGAAQRIAVLLAVVPLTLLASAGSAPAGPNADGALVVHCRDGLAYSEELLCTRYPLPPTCADLNATSTNPNFTWVWVVGAFLDASSPRIARVRFGIASSLPSGFVYEQTACGPVSLELPDPNWPDSGSGTDITYSTPITTTLTKLYSMLVEWNANGDTFGTAGYHGPTAQFIDDAVPAHVDECARFGHVALNAPGQNACPEGTASAGDRAVPAEGASSHLSRISPNPFFGATRIEYTLARDEWMRVEIVDPTGRLVALLADGLYPAGAGSVIWNASASQCGIYFARLTTAEGSTSRKAIALH